MKDLKINDKPKRVPLHEQRRNRLTVEDRDPNYVYRIVNDMDDRVNRFKRAGWDVDPRANVQIGDENVVNNNTSLGTGGRTPVGGGVTGVLMRIPKELYDADQLQKANDIKAKERTMFRRKTNVKDAGEDGTYGEVTLDRK